jgi:hypothetical protein
VARFVDAFEDGDVDGVVALLSDDATLTMPPQAPEYRGPAAIASFLSTVPAGGRLEQFRLVGTRANGQPAFGCYLRDRRSSIMVSGRMCCGVQGAELILRLGPDDGERALESAHVRPMDFTGRPMRGFVMAEPGGLAGEPLRRWVERAAAYPTAAAAAGRG